MECGVNSIPQEESMSTNEELVEEDRDGEARSSLSIDAITQEDGSSINTLMSELNKYK